ncbi:MAG: EAL domain-containing protein [Pseudomonadota bacterium]
MSTEKILVADDDATQRLLTEQYLKQAGFEVVVVSDGQQALEAFHAEKPDLLILDLRMPRMNGYAVCQEVRKTEEGESVPIVMVTGLKDLDTLERAFESGATDFFTKPVVWETLPFRVRYLLRAGRAIIDSRQSELDLLRAQRVAGLVHWELDLNSLSANWSPATRQVFEVDADTIWPDLHAFLTDVHPEDRTRLREQVERLIKDPRNSGSFLLEHRLLIGDGKELTVEQQGELVIDEATQSVRWLGTMQDVTERKRAEKRIHQLAYYDPLTALPNRELFRRRAEQALRAAGRAKSSFALVFIDLDGFKYVNDSLGHDAGDELLYMVSDGLQKTLRSSDLLAKFNQQATDNPSLSRFGGDEFVVLLPEVSSKDTVAAIVDRMLSNIAAPVKTQGREFEVTGSAGISFYPDDGDSVDTLLKNADIAMYQAKQGGKNCYRFYTPKMDEFVQRRLSIESRLKSALANDGLSLAYQPKVELKSGLIVGVEALLRWEDPELGKVAPDQFVPIAEESGLIGPIGEWVIRTACRQAKSWHSGPVGPLQIAVNLSSHQVRSDDLHELVEKTLAETGLDPSLLEFELTESILMDNAERTVSMLQRLKKLGVSMSVDDFGTGYSSMAYLKHFPIDTIKIDKAFVNDISDDSSDAIIVRAIVGLANGLSLNTVAEGVERREQLEFLQRCGCDQVQGFYLYKPMSAQLIEKLLVETDNAPQVVRRAVEL